jgi:hypothetical protein
MKGFVMNKRANMLKLVVAIICANILLGCNTYNEMPTQISDEQVLESFQNDPRIEFRWYGNNKWRLDEDGWDGGGHDPYEVVLKTDRLYSYPHGRLLWGKDDVRLTKNPKLLYPLFDSSDPDVVLAALYCYSKEPIYGHWAQGMPNLTADQFDLGSQLRRLITEHRDVRVRCMAAHILMQKALVTIEDIDSMLSDENLSVQIIGIRSIASISNSIQLNEHEHFTKRPLLTEADNERFGRIFYLIKKKLIPILLKHLNDNHFYIRASCYSDFVSLVERRKYLPNSRMTIERPKMLEKYFEWERESWRKRRDKQQELISWWQDNSESILRNSGAAWHESVANSLKIP